ncbi:MAG: hypothetical protein Q4B30_06800 [Coriobacteriaceae bacterium]|nr:hypothetical protein [Coriobacteriaceae bacterium]
MFGKKKKSICKAAAQKPVRACETRSIQRQQPQTQPHEGYDVGEYEPADDSRPVHHCVCEVRRYERARPVSCSVNIAGPIIFNGNVNIFNVCGAPVSESSTVVIREGQRAVAYHRERRYE